ncbi:hypothetical protein OG937_11200 [Streptomyces sp. NBC_00510]
MIRPASPYRIVARVVAAAAVALSAAACSTGPGPSGSAPVAHAVPARLTHTLPDDPVRMLFPATGAETRWTQGMDVLRQQASRYAAASCARDAGISLPEQMPVAFIPFGDIPDLDFIDRHGFGQSAEVPAPAAGPLTARSGNPAATRSADPAAIRRCSGAGSAAARRTRDAFAPLQGEWFRELASLRRDPATIRALGTLPGCLAGHGFHVRDEDAFFGLVDSRLLTADTTDLPRVNRELGHAYASCMRPVEAVREPARLRLRTRFVDEHADQIRELRKTLVPSLRGTEEQYGLHLSFPAP